MYTQNLSNYDFLKLVGIKIKEIRLEKEYSQEYLSNGICARTTLSKLEQGLLKNIDINVLIKLSSKLDLPFYLVLENIKKEINAHSEIIKEAYLLVCKYNIENIESFKNQIKNNIFSNKEIETYLIISCLFIKSDFHTIISLINKKTDNTFGIFSVINILTMNYYILSFTYSNVNNKVATILQLVNKQYTSIIFYLKYYPQIMIKMLINLAEYYSFINEYNRSSDILNTAEFELIPKSCTLL